MFSFCDWNVGSKGKSGIKVGEVELYRFLEYILRVMLGYLIVLIR